VGEREGELGADFSSIVPPRDPKFTPGSPLAFEAILTNAGVGVVMGG